VSDHGRAHAVLSPSAAERWLSCPASVGLVESLDRGDDGGSEWAAEGTRAHTLAEMEAALAFGLIDEDEYDTRYDAWHAVAVEHGDDIDEMSDSVAQYVALLRDIVARTPFATVRLEQRLQSGVPGCWGTGDAIVVSPSVVVVVDFKYGKGVRVEVEGNPQLRIYGCGALEMYDGVIGEAETVGMAICQPRVSNGITYTEMPAADLLRWRDDVVLPIARETQSPDARFGPSETACRWCPAAGICKPRMVHMARRDFGHPAAMDEQELADAFNGIADLRAWCNAVDAEALRAIYSDHKELPGLKVVMSQGKRSIADDARVIEVLVAEGYDKEAVSRLQAQTLGHLEKVVGKDHLPEVLGDLLKKGAGKPSIVAADDDRPAITSHDQAVKDFQDVPGGEEK
jgi:hypothetical protein